MVRKGASRLDLKNEGLVVFLYDEANRGQIADRGVSLIGGFSGGASELEDETLAALAAKGLLVAYELFQDDDITVEVAVGRPLTQKEAKSARWLPVQSAQLSLPSGRLCVETYNSLRLGSEPPEAAGGVVEVKAGNYLLTLHRLDRDAVEEAGIDDADLPDQFIVLTPIAKSKRPASAPAMLLAAPLETASSPPQYEIQDGVFYGRIRFWPDGVVYTLNLDREAANLLGLVAGKWLRLTVESLALELHAVYLGENLREWNAVRSRLAAQIPPPILFAEASWLSDSELDRDLLFGQPIKGNKPVAEGNRDRWLPVTATLVRAPK